MTIESPVLRRSLPVPSRRSVVRGAAWTVPLTVVSVAAPAFAVSTCAPTLTGTVDWGVTPYTRFSATKGRATATPTGGTVAENGTVVIDFGSVFNTYAPTTDFEDANLQVHPTNVGALGQQGLAFFQTRSAGGNTTNTYNQTVTIDFSRAVTDLSFTLTDIDSSSGNYTDSIGFSVAPTVTFLGTNLQGAGTYSSPLRKTGNNQTVGGNSGDGNVKVAFAGPLTTLTMKYWNSQDNNQQVVYFADMSFKVKPATCP